MTQYVRCVFYSEEISGPIFTKMAHKLAFEHYTPNLQQKFFKVDVKRRYLGRKIENWKSEQGDLLVDSKASFCAIFVKIDPLSSSE